MNKTAKLVRCCVDSLQSDTENIFLDVQKEAETSKLDRLPADDVYFVRNRENIFLPKISCVLRHSVILEDALSSVKKPFSVFGKLEENVLKMFEGLMGEMLKENGVDEEDTKNKLIFVRSRFVLGGYFPCLKNYDGNG